jgi:hypothetical protein
MDQHPSAPLRQTITGRAETPIFFVKAIAQAYTQCGMDPMPALNAAQIAPNLLNHHDARITALQMEWLSASAMRALDDEALGWFGRRLPWGSYGMLVRASLPSAHIWAWRMSADGAATMACSQKTFACTLGSHRGVA